MPRVCNSAAIRALVLITGVMLGSTTAGAMAESPDKRPNILLIVADDLGWSDLGAFGGEIETPNLDALALQGLRFTQFHAAPACSPTRAELLTGVDHHIAGIGAMAEAMPPSQKGKPGYEGHLNDRVVTVAELLKDAGYTTLFAGKWHLGLTPALSPAARGFEQSFALLPGGANHFGTETGIQSGSTANPYMDGMEPVTALPANYYSSDYFTDKMIGYLETRADKKKPFFAYLSFQAPHWPLQAPPESIAKYRGRYDAGFNILRAERLKNQASLGLEYPDVVPHPVVGRTTFGSYAKDWGELTELDRNIAARKMEVYAGMVDRMDENIGRLMATLKRLGVQDNTVIIFLSDNGAEGGLYSKVPMADGSTFGDYVKAHYDNKLANIGSATSMVWYGPRWAQAATAPSNLYKAYTTEGGTRVAAFIRYPGFARQAAISKVFVSVRDVTPTLLSLTGVAHPKTYRGHEVAPMTGVPMTAYLSNGAERVHPEDAVFGWELHGRMAVRKGHWKAVNTPPPDGSGKWELFDLKADPGEINDLAGQMPDKLQQLLRDWEAYTKANNILPPPNFTLKFGTY